MRVVSGGNPYPRLQRAPRPGVICCLTDVVMPQMSGIDLAAQLLEARPALPVLYMSGYSERNAL